MTAILYTTTDAIRGAIGVDTKDITDDQLSDQLLETQLTTDLYGWFPTYAAVYTAGTGGSASGDEMYQKNLLVMYCLFYGAVRLVEMIMAMPQKVSDGKSQMERFDIDWEALLARLEGRRDEARSLLEEILNPGDGGTSYFGRATPAYDPVTNT